MNASARLQLVRDRFIAGQVECSLRRHLDSVGPDSPIRDIVDRCHVWESHAEDMDNLRNCHSPDRPQVVYQVVNVNTDSDPKVALEDSDVLGLLVRHLLPTSAVSPPRVAPILSDRELLIQRLLATVHPVQPVVQERSSITDIAILLQSLLPVGSVVEETMGPPADRQEPTAVCFSCGESSHASRAMQLRGVLFWTSHFLSCLLDGGWIGWMMNLYCDHPQGGLTVIKRETSTDPGRGLVAQISDYYGLLLVMMLLVMMFLIRQPGMWLLPVWGLSGLWRL